MIHPFLTLALDYIEERITLEEYHSGVAALKDAPPFSNYYQFGDETGTSTALLREVFDPMRSRFENDHDLASRMSQLSVLPGEDKPQIAEDTAYRRIYGVLAEQSEVTNNYIADILLLACDERVSEHDLPFFPLSQKGAELQLAGWLEDKGEKVDEVEFKRLARQLYRFSIGFVNGGRLTGDRIAVEREEKLLVQYAKQYENKRTKAQEAS